MENNQNEDINLSEPLLLEIRNPKSNKDLDKKTHSSISKKSEETFTPNKALGHFYNLLSILCFFFTNVLIKVQYLIDPNITFQIAQFYRSGFTTILAVFHIFISRDELDLDKNLKNKKLLFFNSVLGNITGIFFLFSCFYLRLGTAYAILYSYPLFGFLFALCLLNEKIQIIDVIGLLTGFFSFFVMLHFGEVEQPFEDGESDLLNSKNSTILTTIIGVACALIGSLSIALRTIVLKVSANENVNIHFLNFWSGLLGFLIALTCLFDSKQRMILMNSHIIITNLIIGFLIYSANYTLSKSFGNISVVESSIPSFLSIILSFVAGSFIFNNSLGWLDILGSTILIVFCYFYISCKVRQT